MRNKNIKYVLVFLLIIIGCSSKDTKDESKQQSINHEFKTFDSLFTSTTTEQYHIFSYETYNEYHEKIKLTAIPKILYKFIESNYDSISNPNQEYYAVYKFDYNKNIKGYIYTYQSQYSLSAVGLLLYDKKMQTILGKNEVADSFGDEGWYFQKDGWLKDINNDGYLDIVNHQTDWNINEDDTTQNIQSEYQIVNDSLFAHTYNSINKTFIETYNVNYISANLVLKNIYKK